ncbi:maleate cis-trans isomerase family protein [Halegenticoccus tardaugens]|uniref:maleate cis-trans isomerase family protein n=1 Tax=Halegenticoccus tardaugens TaxID=2071624 RepID=UPI00100AA1A6|nr:aspartate/glutamate racemase family protein [Halegenticoccus tardaugens]
MFGWRARLGIVVPSSNSTVEPEFAAAVPAGVSVHAARMPLSSVTASGLDEMASTATACAERLAHADVDAVAYACTSGSLLHGREFAAGLEDELAAAAGRPAVATARSVDRALSALSVDRLALVTPYVDDLTEREVRYLEAGGRSVVAVDGRGIEDNAAIGALGPEDAYRQVRRTVEGSALDTDELDGVFVSCTNYRTFPAIERLEADLGVPVVTSNGATLWDALRTVGVATDAVPGRLGRL